MGAPIVYRSDDANAPVARGERGALIELLTACLVDGYGDKPAAGWTRPFINAEGTRAAFRNIAGTGRFLEIDEATSANDYQPKTRGWETMSSESDGLGPFAATFQTTTQVSSAANTTPRPWAVIADDKYFYMFIWYATTGTVDIPALPSGYNSGLSFGDLVKHDPNDSYACVLGSCVYGVQTIGEPNITGAEAYAYYFSPRPIDGSPTPTPLGLIRGGGPGVDGLMGGANGGPTWVTGDPVLYTRPFINNKLPYTLRGWIPGLYYPCHTLSFENMAIISTNGGQMLSVRTIATSGQPQNIFISLDDWWV